MRAEIQIRSILQHAWAEIEHDLGYKSKNEVPAQIRRSFARVAGLLELADHEFMRIREELSTYSSQVRRQIQQSPQAVSVDRDSLKTYIEGSELVNRLDADIAETAGALHVYQLLDDILSLGARASHAAGITTIFELAAALEELSDRLPSFVKRYFAGLNLGNRAITRGACIFFVSLFLVARSGDQRRVANLFLRSWDGPGVGWDVNNLAATAIAAAADEQ